MGSDNHIIGLFPTPFLRVEGLLPPALVAQLIAELADGPFRTNTGSAKLAHSAILAPQASPVLGSVCALITPRLVDLGQLMFGQRLTWSIKEIWGNVLEHGGHQAAHNHANSFISGVLYLTDSHPSANTVFMKGLGGRDFAFVNAGPDVEMGPFNADKWIAPDPAPGDLILFPSYLLHEVPPNQGARRISLAFNAVPTRLDAWGYGLSMSG